jgi:glycosyltransferase involved in cell wall biosynthesis
LKIKILHISSYDRGGAAVSSMRVHKGLLNAGVDSSFLYGQGNNCADGSYSISRFNNLIHKFGRRISKLKFKYGGYSLKGFYSFLPPHIHIKSQIEKHNPDLVHLHWVSDLLHPALLSDIKKPIIWSLHDLNPLTGGCHYTSSCNLFQIECHACPALGSVRCDDISRYQFLKKANAYKSVKINFVGSSKWITSTGMSSVLGGGHCFHHLPTPIDTVAFSPITKQAARLKLGISTNKKIILFGADRAMTDPRKGFHLLLEALQVFNGDKNQYKMLIVGDDLKSDSIEGFEAHSIGIVKDESLMHALFCSADLFVAPSVEENLSNMIMESIACGTPVLAFNIGGNPDMIDHLSNGYLVNEVSGKALSDGLFNFFGAENLGVDFSGNARKKAVECFDNSVVIPQYLDLYKQILNGRDSA